MFTALGCCPDLVRTHSYILILKAVCYSALLYIYLELKQVFVFFFKDQLSLLFGLPGNSDDKESACNTGDLSLIPGSGRFPGEGNSYPLQYSWASLVAQMVKNPPTMRETWV